MTLYPQYCRAIEAGIIRRWNCDLIRKVLAESTPVFDASFLKDFMKAAGIRIRRRKLTKKERAAIKASEDEYNGRREANER